MDITPKIDPGLYEITGYGASFYSVNGKQIHSSLVVCPWKYFEIHQSSGESYKDFNPIFDLIIEDIILRNTREEVIILFGNKDYVPNEELKEKLNRNNASLNAMDSTAACRTYNILLSEARIVYAVLFL